MAFFKDKNSSVRVISLLKIEELSDELKNLGQVENDSLKEIIEARKHIKKVHVEYNSNRLDNCRVYLFI